MNQLKDLQKVKTIVISEQNWKKIQSLGLLGETYNDVITRIFNGNKK
jgi:hypothetical protein